MLLVSSDKKGKSYSKKSLFLLATEVVTKDVQPYSHCTQAGG
jgi:hypothetical protein